MDSKIFYNTVFCMICCASKNITTAYKQYYRAYPIQENPISVEKFGQRYELAELTTGEILISIRVKEVLEKNKVSGISFLPIYSDVKQKQLITTHMQLRIDNILPEIFSETQIFYENGALFYKQGTPLVYEEDKRENFKDFNKTSECWGYPYRPNFIISDKVYKLLKDIKYYAPIIEPIQFVENHVKSFFSWRFK